MHRYLKKHKQTKKSKQKTKGESGLKVKWYNTANILTIWRKSCSLSIHYRTSETLNLDRKAIFTLHFLEFLKKNDREEWGKS